MKRVLVALALVLVADAAYASAAHPPVRLRLDDSIAACVADVSAVERVVAVELGADLVATDDLPETTTVTVTCDAGDVTIAVDDPITNKSLQRHLPLSEEPQPARARLLGVTIAETVAASWIELDMTSASPQPSRPDEDDPVWQSAALTARTRLVVAPSPRASELSVSVESRVFSAGGLLTVGGRLAGEWPLGKRWGFGLDAAAEGGESSVAGGAARVWLASVLPHVSVNLFSGLIDARLNGGFRVGMAGVAGMSPVPGLAGRSFLSSWGGPAASFEASASITRRVGVTLGIETGIITLAVDARVNGTDAARVDGVWGGAWISVAFRP